MKPLKVEIDGVVFDENIESVRVFVDPDPEPETKFLGGIPHGMIAAVSFSQAKVIDTLRKFEAKMNGPQRVTANWVKENTALGDMDQSGVSAILSHLKGNFVPPLITNNSEAGDGSRSRLWCLTERGRTAILVGTTPSANKRLEPLFHQW